MKWAYGVFYFNEGEIKFFCIEESREGAEIQVKGLCQKYGNAWYTEIMTNEFG